MKKFKDLTKIDKEYLRFIYHEDMTHSEKMEILTKKFGAAERTIRYWWKENLGLSTYDLSAPDSLQGVSGRALPEGTDVVLFTSCQNKTGINKGLLENMNTYAKFMKRKGFNPEIVVAPTRYRNPTSPSEQERKGKSEEWWIDEIIPYLYFSKIQFGDTILSARSRIRPTAKNPLTGYEVLAKDNNLVLPHNKIHFKTLPRFKNKPLRSMSTTGVLSRKNYSDSKAGETGDLHHSYGFVVVELDKNNPNKTLTPRNVKAKDDGSFCDLWWEVKEGKVSKVDSVEGFIWGDIHDAVKNDEVFNETLDMCKKHFKPKKHVLHDLFDGYTVNPHEKKDMYIQKKKIMEGKYLIKDEIESTYKTVERVAEVGDEVYVTTSNHDVFLDRMVNDDNWKKDLHNSESYLTLALMQQNVDLETHGSLYGYLFNEKFFDYPKHVIYIPYGYSLDIGGYECALHGDHGANGSKGSTNQFAKLNTKIVCAHQHSPQIMNSVTVVGVTANISQYYTRKGMSSWAYAHCVIHNNNKSQLFVFNDNYKITNLT